VTTTSSRKALAIEHRKALVELIIEYVRDHPNETNAEIAAALGLESSFEGGHRNYLTFSLLSQAVESGSLIRSKDGANVRYAQKGA
jgi:hypothetical protein